MLSLNQLLKELALPLLEQDKELVGISCDSREIKPGFVFYCRKGKGENFCAQALEAGAVVILSEEPLSKQYTSAQFTISKELSYGAVCSLFFDNPKDSLRLIAVTGTNGKSTISWMIYSLLKKLGARAGFIGTFAYEWPNGREKAPWTTPDPAHLHRLLAAMKKDDCRYVAMEASSHALEQGRLETCEFDVVIFTGLTHDHLDYHGDMEAYYQSKKRLFTENLKKDGLAIIATDNEWGERLYEECKAQVKCVAVGVNSTAERQIHVREQSILASEFSFVGDSAVYKVPVAGDFNVANAASSILALENCGFSADEIAPALFSFDGTPGRLQALKCDPEVFVDYAHTPDALVKVLQTLKKLCSGKLIIVFGCGGDRDQAKRSLMGRAASDFADEIILCDDNPRFEDGAFILNQIASGIEGHKSFSIIADRAAAIAKALDLKEEGDCLLIAGKGHEDYQIVGGERFDFSDVEVATRLIGEKKK